ncbi:hypothetical protein [Nocardia thraciensis]
MGFDKLDIDDPDDLNITAGHRHTAHCSFTGGAGSVNRDLVLTTRPQSTLDHRHAQVCDLVTGWIDRWIAERDKDAGNTYVRTVRTNNGYRDTDIAGGARVQRSESA